MKESLTPEKIQKGLSTGALTKENAVELLVSLIESSDNIKIRLEGIETLQKLNLKSERIYKILENYLISDENAYVRASVAQYIIHNYLEYGISALRWTIQHEKSPLVIRLFFDFLEKFDSHRQKLIKKDLFSWNKKFSSQIGVDPQESRFFLDLEALFARGKINYEIDPYGYKHFEILSDTKNDEPWLVITDTHVQILNFNYFNWNFIKNNSGIIDSLSKLHDLDVYLCSLKKYSNKDDFISSIPDSIGLLTNLKKLILRRNGLKKLPVSLKNLNLLKELDLSYNHLEEIPQFITSLNALEKLNIKHNIIQDIPEFLFNNIILIR